MKKKFYFPALLFALACFGTPTQAQTPYSEIFEGWEDAYSIENILNLFKEAGSSSLSEEQLERLPDWQFKQSHVPLRNVILDKDGQLNPDLDPKRNVFFNCPIGSTGDFSGFPSDSFADDAFTLWPYVKIHGNWSTRWFGSSGAFLDTAHKHGTAGLSGLVFFDTTGGGAADGMSELRSLLCTKDGEGNYVYVEPLLDALAFFGQDGVNFNDEAHMYNNDLGGFFEKVTERAKQRGQVCHLGWYGSPSFSNGNATAYFGPNGKPNTTAYMLNYGSTVTSKTTDEQAAALVAANRIDADAPYEIYSGKWIVSLARGEGYYSFKGIEDAKTTGIAPWGEHSQNRIYQHTTGKSLIEYATEYQKRQEMFFSGGRRRLAEGTSGLTIEPTISGMSSEALAMFTGLGTYCPERSSIQGTLPFGTTFCTGNGEYFFNCGEKLYGNWYNLAAQDMQPTYRWLVRKANSTEISSDIDPSFTYEDAWIGGTSLKLSGKAITAGTDVHLYRTNLTAGNGAKARVAFKVKGGRASDASNLCLIVKKTTGIGWDEFPLGNVRANGYNGWDVKEIALTGYASSDVIKAIGVRVKGSADNYEALVGEINITNEMAETVAAPINFTPEVKGETTTSMSLKLTWQMPVPAGLTKAVISNEDANVDHFEIFTKIGDYRKKMVARTTQWAMIFHDLTTKNDERLRVGIRAVSSDLKTKSAIVWMDVEKDPFAQDGVEDYYCKSYSNGGAKDQRYLTELKTVGAKQDIMITRDRPLEDITNYINYADQYKLEVDPGSEFMLSWEAFGYPGEGATITDPKHPAADGLQMTRVYVYADWNRDYDFNPDDAEGNEANFFYGAKGVYDESKIHATSDGERLVAFGKALQGQGSSERYEVMKRSFKIKVPENAKPGVSRLRLIFDDAWFDHKGACNTQITKGLSVDIMMVISGVPGDDGGHEVEEVHVGDADLQSDSYTPVDGSIVGVENIQGDKNEISRFYPSVTKDYVYFNFTDKVEIYTLQGVLVRTKNGGVNNINVSELPNGIYIVRMYNKGIAVTGKIMKK